MGFEPRLGGDVFRAIPSFSCFGIELSSITWFGKSEIQGGTILVTYQVQGERIMKRTVTGVLLVMLLAGVLCSAFNTKLVRASAHAYARRFVGPLDLSILEGDYSYISPSISCVKVGETTIVEVVSNSTQLINEFYLVMYWDSGYVQCTDIQLDLFPPGMQSSYTIDNENCVLEAVASAPPSTWASTGMMASITFSAIGEGDCGLRLFTKMEGITYLLESHKEGVIVSRNWLSQLSGVSAFQPEQVLYQDTDQLEVDPGVKYDAGLKMVAGKSTVVFSWPNQKDKIWVNVTNPGEEDQTFKVRMEARPDCSVVFETTYYTVPAGQGLNISIDSETQTRPFMFTRDETKCNNTVEIILDPDFLSSFTCNRVIVDVEVVRTLPMSLLFLPLVLYNGTTGQRLHDPVNGYEVATHEREATDFIRATYPVADDKITSSSRPWTPVEINHTEVQAFPDDPQWDRKVDIPKVLEKVLASSAFSADLVSRIVLLVPDDWPKTYTYKQNSSGIFDSEWKGASCPDYLEAVLVKLGYWGTTAHEIGHTLGLRLPIPPATEEYHAGYAGNSAPGYWVYRRPNGDRPSSTICFMGSANRFHELNTWVCREDYRSLLDILQASDPEALLIGGLISKNGTTQLGKWYRLPSGVTDTDMGDTGNLSIAFLDALGYVIGSTGFNLTFLLLGDETVEVEVTCFAFSVPYVNGTTLIKLYYNGTVVGEKIVSPHSPEVSVTYPVGGEILNMFSPNMINWTGNDLDNDALVYSVGYSSDGGQTWTPIVTDLATTSYVWNTSALPSGKSCRVKIVATDEINVGQDMSDSNFTMGIANLCAASLSPSKTVFVRGYNLNINATVQNTGDFSESFNVSCYLGGSYTQQQADIFQGLGDVDSDGVIDQEDLYIIGHNQGWTGIPGENPADVNRDGVVNVLDLIMCNAHQTLNIWSYFELWASIETKSIYDLHPEALVTLTFIWNTTGYTAGKYPLKANVTQIAYEANLTDNTFFYDHINIAVSGDLNGDGSIDIYDIAIVAVTFGSTPVDANWNPNADVNDDGIVDIFDIVVVALHFGETG